MELSVGFELNFDGLKKCAWGCYDLWPLRDSTCTLLRDSSVQLAHYFELTGICLHVKQ